VGRQKGEKNVFASAGHHLKGRHFLPPLAGILLGDREVALRIFDLHDVDRVVRLIQQQVNLRALRTNPIRTMHPGAMISFQSRNAQRALELWHMFVGECFKRVTAPGLPRRRTGLLQETTIPAFSPLNPLEVEQRMFISQTVDRILAFLSIRQVWTGEPGFLQLNQSGSQSAACGIGAGQPNLSGAQELAAFRQGKRSQFHTSCHSIVKTTLVIDDLGDHPRDRRTADDENDAWVA